MENQFSGENHAPVQNQNSPTETHAGAPGTPKETHAATNPIHEIELHEHAESEVNSLSTAHEAIDDATPAEVLSQSEQPHHESHRDAHKEAESHEVEPSDQQESDSQQHEHDTQDVPEAQSAPETVLEPGSLEDFANRNKHARLQPEEETETIRLLKDCLLGGRSEVARAIAVTPSLPWVISVQATTLAWPEMKPSFRSQFLAGLARIQGEHAARVRLSLARGLYKVDQRAALKLILLTLKVLRNKETGLLEGKGASTFANVLIGRGKAWVLQVPLQELKPAEADLLVFAALHSAFYAPQAPITQLGILRWAVERLTKLSPALEQMILKGVNRWSGKWQATLRKEVSPLPEAWEEVLKVPPIKGAVTRHKAAPVNRPEIEKEASAEHGEDSSASEENEDHEHGGNTRERERDDLVEGDSDEEHEDSEKDEAGHDGDESTEDEDDTDEDEDVASHPKARPVYVSKTVPNHGASSHIQPGRRGGPGGHFNLTDTLRQIENHVAGLRNELHTAQKQLRQRDDDTRRGRRAEKHQPQANPGELSVDELTRLNQQLELRNAELKLRIDELTLDSEERAASCGLITDAPAPDPNTQLQALLGWKLKDDYDDFLALQQESRDLVVQQHYKTLLGHVFEVLHAEGVKFELPEAQG